MLTFAIATQADIPVLAKILTAAYHYKLKHQDASWGSEQSDVFTEKEVAHQLTLGVTYLARLDSRPVATFMLQWEDPDVWGQQPPDAGYLHRLAVSADQHGQKLGQQLIEHAAQVVRANHRQFLRLDCIADNTDLCAYYEQRGFQLIETRQTLVNPHLSALYQRSV